MSGTIKRTDMKYKHNATNLHVLSCATQNHQKHSQQQINIILVSNAQCS